MNCLRKMRKGQCWIVLLIVSVLRTASSPCPAYAQTCVDYSQYMSWVGGLESIGISDIAVVGNIAYASSSSGLHVIDVSVPFAPSIIAIQGTPDGGRAVAVDGDYAYLAHESLTLRAFDVSLPQSPQLLSELDTQEYARDIVISGDYAFLACGNDGLRIIDISDPADPRPRGQLETPGFAWRIAVSGNRAYLALGLSGLVVADIADPNLPGLIAQVTVSHGAFALDLQGDHAYVMNPVGLSVVDVTAPAFPVVAVAATRTSQGAYDDARIQGDYLYASGIDGVEVFAIANPASPQWSGVVDLPWSGGRVEVAGAYAYVVDVNGIYGNLQVVDIISPVSVPTVGSLSTGGLAGDVVVENEYAYIAAGVSGLAIADVSVPDAPVIVREVDSPGTALDVAINGNRAHVADGDGGLRIVDISVPEAAYEIGGFAITGAQRVAVYGAYSYIAAGYGGLWAFSGTTPVNVDLTLPYVTDVAVVGDYLYTTGSRMIHVFELVNPGSPAHVGAMTLQRNPVTIDVVNGSHLFVAEWDGMEIVELLDGRNPQVVGGVVLPGYGRGVVVSGEYAYVALMTGVKVVNISQLTDPWLVGSVDPPPQYGEGVALAGDYIYYAHGSGLEVLPMQCAGPADNTIVVSMPVNGPASVRVHPAGLFVGPTHAVQWDGVVGHTPRTVDATISVQISNLRKPVAGIPASDIWLESSNNGLRPCSQGTIASGPTDSYGRTTITGPLFAGGYSDFDANERAIVVVQGTRIVEQPLEIFFNGSDNTGNGIVDLADAGFFTVDLFKDYNYRSDIWWDGVINITDVGMFSYTLQGGCPSAQSEIYAAPSSERFRLYFDVFARDSSVEAEMGEIVEAFLVYDGALANNGLAGWQCVIESSDVLEFVSADIFGSGYNYAEAPAFVVGVGDLLFPEPRAPLILASVRFRVTGRGPGEVHLTGSRVRSDGAAGGVVSVGTSRDLFRVDLRNDNHDGVAAWVNCDDCEAIRDQLEGNRDLDLWCGPNPLNPAIDVHFRLSQSRDVRFEVYDLAGRLVREFAAGEMGPGRQTIRWDGAQADGSPVASGIYFGQLLLDGAITGRTQKMTVIK